MVPIFDSDVPLVAAPMAGGPSTPALVTAVSGAGGFGFLAAGYQDPDTLSARIAEVRGAGVTAFGVNVFVPTPVPIDPDAFAAYAADVAGEPDLHGVDLTDPPLVEDDDRWQDKIDLLITDPVPVVSFTFGVPAPSVIADLRRAGSAVLVTVTTVAEARAAAEAGVDGLVAQGVEAGGHRGTHAPPAAADEESTAQLTRHVIDATGLPVIAGGGVAGAEDVAAVLAAGAEAVAIGTLLLRAEESGASPTHRAALTDPRFERTVITRAFTGRPARALHNGFVTRHADHAPLGYPAVHHLTRSLRAAAARDGDPDAVHLWAGTGFRHARVAPAAEIVAELVRSV